MAHEGHDTSDVQQLRREVQQMIGDSQAFLLDTMRSMLVEFNKDNGQSESGSAEGSAAVRESPEGAGSTPVGQSPARVGPTAVRETILRDGGFAEFRRDGTRRRCCSCRGWSREGPARPAREGWRDGCIIRAVSSMVVLVCLPRAWLTSTPRRLTG